MREGQPGRQYTFVVRTATTNRSRAARLFEITSQQASSFKRRAGRSAGLASGAARGRSIVIAVILAPRTPGSASQVMRSYGGRRFGFYPILAVTVAGAVMDIRECAGAESAI
jgi:hypothetical protein